MTIDIGGLKRGVVAAWVAFGCALTQEAMAQSNQAALFVANNGNCEGSVTSFTINGDGSLNFVQKVITGSVTCGSGQTAPGLNAQAIDISPNGRWLVTGHGTISGTVEQLTFFEVFSDATFSILFTTTTPDSPVNVKWIDDEYLAVTAHPVGNDFVIIYHFDPVAQSITQHYYQPVPYIFEIVVDREHDYMITRAGSFGMQPFRINPDRTITKLTPAPVPTGIYFLGAGLSGDGTKIYYGGGISSANGLSSRW
ncbi:MAG: hypothetical protein L0219_06030, partial [Phycisphaerales bacterium]|nr:hypothetical protein [Phycisphaerales bacterium]